MYTPTKETVDALVERVKMLESQVKALSISTEQQRKQDWFLDLFGIEDEETEDE